MLFAGRHDQSGGGKSIASQTFQVEVDVEVDIEVDIEIDAEANGW